jgi:hypothetical protein
MTDARQCRDPLLDRHIVQNREKPYDNVVLRDHELFPPLASGQPDSLNLAALPAAAHVRSGTTTH